MDSQESTTAFETEISASTGRCGLKILVKLPREMTQEDRDTASRLGSQLMNALMEERYQLDPTRQEECTKERADSNSTVSLHQLRNYVPPNRSCVQRIENRYKDRGEFGHMTRIRELYETCFLAIDFALALLLSAVLVFTSELFLGPGVLTDAMEGNHQAIYTSIASVCGSLLGFVITAVSIILVFGQVPKMRMITKSGHYGTIFDIHFHAIRCLGAATAWAFLALFVDTDKNPMRLISYVMMVLVILVAFRVFRCVWILRHITRELANSMKA